MNANKRRTARMFRGIVGVFSVCLLSFSTVVVAQSTKPAAAEKKVVKKKIAAKETAAAKMRPQPAVVGVITGTNVYIRSGFCATYYPVTKLDRGNEVTVVDEQFGWCKILPPAGTFSLVDKTYIDVLDDKTGVANGNIWVYAGSSIDKRRYAKQVKLRKGDRVGIIGETEDGAFYRIVPPVGAHLWVSGDFVDRSGKTARAGSPKPPALEPVKPGELKLTQKTSQETKSQTAKSDKTGSKKTIKAVAPDSTLGSVQHGSLAGYSSFSEKYQVSLDAIQAEITAESNKPITDRVFEPILVKLQAIADQTEDEAAQLYATSRLKQLRDHIELISAVREMRELRENAVSIADEAARKRELIRARSVPPLDTIVVRGEIRVSGIYDGSADRPKRWRVVDPKSGRTLAYIEVPQGSPIDPVQYYGKYIGIRASDCRLLRGTIPPAWIYTVEEISVLDPAAESKKPAGRTGERAAMKASPTPTAIPATKPAAAAPGTAPAD